MQIVIEIPEREYKVICENYYVAVYACPNLLSNAIKNGKQIDLDGLKQDMKSIKCGYPYGLDYLLKCIENRLGIRLEDCE